jgi:uncharacterized protein YbaR (Trm112 family)
MDNRLLDILCCPDSKQPLSRLTGAELALINQAIAAGGVQRSDGSPQAEALAEGLVTRDRRTVYRVDDGIPVLLVDEALATTQIPDFPR